MADPVFGKPLWPLVTWSRWVPSMQRGTILLALKIERSSRLPVTRDWRVISAPGSEVVREESNVNNAITDSMDGPEAEALAPAGNCLDDPECAGARSCRGASRARATLW